MAALRLRYMECVARKWMLHTADKNGLSFEHASDTPGIFTAI